MCQTKRLSVLLASLLTIVFSVNAQIAVNQIGYHLSGSKIAIVPGSATGQFQVTSTDGSKVYYTGGLGPALRWNPAEANYRIVDFTEFSQTGDFIIYLTDTDEQSYPFTISTKVFDEVGIGSLKAYYLIRASMELEKEYAGEHARPLGHPDTVVYVHSSAASAERPTGTKISCPKGWYDAGDYNKYVINSGISTFSLMSFYEYFPEFSKKMNTNIPESNNGVPDILDEAKWNLDWVLSMQDPNDGGVYHKCTGKKFDGSIMPHQYKQSRWLVMKTTTAALDFAALAAQASRIYKEYESEFPGFSEKCIIAAQKAWTWAREHPKIAYKQPDDVNTGAYGDGNPSDEFRWAALELYLTTQNDSFYNAVNQPKSGFGMPGWPNVGTLGVISILANKNLLTDKAKADLAAFESGFTKLADNTVNEYNKSAYKVSNTGFYWGSNGSIANQGMILMIQYALTGEQKYLDAAIGAHDYLLGRNPTGFSFLTGFGAKTPMNIHHRPSKADGVKNPVPGLLAGGANPQNQYDCGESAYGTKVPALSFIDSYCSYSTNEICINWNAPLVFLSNALAASMKVVQEIETGMTDSIDGKKIYLKFNVGFPEGAIATEGFSITLDDQLAELTAVLVDELDSTTLILSLVDEIPIETNSIIFSYSNGNLSSILGDKIGVIPETKILNVLKGAAPVVVSAKTHLYEDLIEVELSKEMENAAVQLGNFKLFASAFKVGILSVSSEGNLLQIVPERSISPNDKLTLFFSGDDFFSVDGGKLATFEWLPIENHSAPLPELLKVESDLSGDTIKVFFSEKLNADSLLASQFIVEVGGNAIPIDGIFLNASERNVVLLNLGSTIQHSDEAKIQFTTGQLASDKGKNVPSFGPQDVENKVYIPVALPGLIEAESWLRMEGFQTEETTDEGGGLNVGWTEEGDFMEYKIVVEEADTFSVEYRVAAQSENGIIELSLNGEPLDVANFDATGDWQNWISVENCVFVPQGEHLLKLSAKTDGFNINWIKFSSGCSIPSGIPSLADKIRLYPNPASGFIEVLGWDKPLDVSIYNAFGQKVKSVSSHGENQISLQGIAKGLYLINLKGEGIDCYKRVVKQ